MFDLLRQDFFYAARNLIKHRGYTFVIVLTLAVAIGGSTAVFSVVNGVLLRSLPYKSPERLVMIWNQYGKMKMPRANNSPPDFLDRKRENRTLENLAAIEESSMNLIGRREPQRIRAARVSASLFSTLGVLPSVGRDFSEEEDRPGRNSVVILSYDFWKTQFGSQPGIIGRTLNLSNSNYVVIGIMPKSFWFPRPEVDLWIPIAFTQEQTSDAFRGNESLAIVARIKSGVTFAQVQSDMNRIAQGVINRVPDRRDFLINSGWGAFVVALRDSLVGEVRSALLILMGAVSFLLLIGCANVANLILARNLSREKEFGIRTALGANRGALIRLISAEALLLAFSGGIIGVFLAFVSIKSLPSIAPEQLPRITEIAIDQTVLTFSMFVSLLTAFLIGIIPALRKSLNRPMQSINMEGTSSTGKSAHRFGNFLLITQISLALVLATGAGLLMKSFRNLMDVNPGFQTEDRVTFTVSLPSSQYSDDARIVGFYEQLMDRIRALPAVRAAGATASLPIAGENWTATFTVEGSPLRPGEPQPGFEYRMVTSNYFRAMGIPLLNGRDFGKFDTAASTRVVVIDENLANRYWKNQNPIGKRIAFSSSSTPRWREIVGVVGHIRNAGLNEAGKEQIYLPHAQAAQNTMSVVIDACGIPSNLIAQIRTLVKSLDPNLPVYQIRAMDEILSQSSAQPRFNMLLFVSFAGMALILAAVGIYGLLSYSVSQRKKEIGIRIALGAKPENVLFLILRQSMRISAAGMITGLAASVALSRFLQSLLFGMRAIDPLVYCVTVLTSILITLIATSIPAKRAADLDPLQTLRES